ncbi:MAG: hypothetical protein ABIE74_00920 [Pseudomonadota bacterium]
MYIILKKHILIFLLLTLFLIPLSVKSFEWGDLLNPFSSEGGEILEEVIPDSERFVTEEGEPVEEEEGFSYADVYFTEPENYKKNYAEVVERGYEEQVRELMQENGFAMITSAEIVIAGDEKRFLLELGEANQLIIDVEYEVGAAIDDPLYLYISSFTSNDTEEYQMMGPGYEVDVQGNIEGKHLTFTFKNPEIEEYMNQIMEMMDPEELEQILAGQKKFDSNFFHELFSKLHVVKNAYAQEYPAELGEGPIETPFVEGGIYEPGEIGTPQPYGVSEGGASPENPVPWGDTGAPPGKKEYPNESPYQIVGEEYGFGIGKHDGRIPARYFTIFPSVYNFKERGIEYNPGNPRDIKDFLEGKFAGQELSYKFKMRVIRDKAVAKAPTKPKQASTAQAGCVYIRYDQTMPSYVRNVPTNLMGLEPFQKYPIYKLCGMNKLYSAAKDPILSENFTRMLNGVITRIWKYTTGFGLMADSLKIGYYPKGLNYHEVDIELKNASEMGKDLGKMRWSYGGKSAVIGGQTRLLELGGSSKSQLQLKIDLNLDELLKYSQIPKTSQGFSGEDLMCGVVAEQVMRSFSHYNIYYRGNSNKHWDWYTKGAVTDDALAAYMIEEMCDLASPWANPRGQFPKGWIGFTGDLHFKTASSLPYRNLNEPYVLTPGGYIFSEYLRSTDKFRGFFLEEIMKGNAIDIEEYVSKLSLDPSKPLTPEILAGLQSFELARYVENFLFCKLYGQKVMDFDLKDFDGSDRHYDTANLKLQEVGSNQWDYYAWMNCGQIAASVPNKILQSFYADKVNNVVGIFDMGKLYAASAKKVADGLVGTSIALREGYSPINFIAELEPAVPSGLYTFRSGNVDVDAPLADLRMLPMSIVYGYIDFAQVQKKDKENKNKVTFQFFAKDENFIKQYLSNVYVMSLVVYADGSINYGTTTLAQLPFSKNRIETVVNADRNGKILVDKTTGEKRIKTMLLKELSFGDSPAEGYNIGVIDRIYIAIVNGNTTGPVVNAPEGKFQIACTKKGNECDKFGLVCVSGLNVCKGLPSVTPVLVKAFADYDKCPKGMEINKEGKCSCPDPNSKWGETCNMGFEPKLFTEKDGSQGCACRPDCDPGQRWDDESKECVNCASGEYNAYFDLKNPGSVTECRSCDSQMKNSKVEWTNTSSTQSGNPIITPDSKAKCECPDKFNEESTTTSTKSYCKAPCREGDYWFNDHCEPCRHFETSSDDRLKCVNCNTTGQAQDWLYHLKPTSKYFIISQDDAIRGCGFIKDRCGFAHMYNLNTRKCDRCPTYSSSAWSQNDPSTGQPGPVNSCVCNSGDQILSGQRCPTDCIDLQRNIGWDPKSKTCINCGTKAILNSNSDKCIACPKYEIAGNYPGQVGYSCVCDSVCKQQKQAATAAAQQPKCQANQWYNASTKTCSTRRCTTDNDYSNSACAGGEEKKYHLVVGGKAFCCKCGEVATYFGCTSGVLPPVPPPAGYATSCPAGTILSGTVDLNPDAEDSTTKFQMMVCCQSTHPYKIKYEPYVCGYACCSSPVSQWDAAKCNSANCITTQKK